MAAEDPLYVPSKWGQEFHSLTVDEALGAGAAGPGKSLCLLMDALDRIFFEQERCTYPKNHPLYHALGDSVGWALHLRRTRPQLEQTIVRAHRIFPKIDPKVHFEAQRAIFTFSSGYKYQFGHCHDPNDWENYQSNQYDWIGFDELTQFTQEQYNQIKSRKRSSDPWLRLRLKVRAMSNPLMRREANDNFLVDDPHWVRRHFVDPAPSGREIIRKLLKVNKDTGDRLYTTRIYLPATLYDNPDPDFVADYEKTLLDLPEHIRAALLYGNWYATPDSFFGYHWRQELHVCEPFDVPRDWYQFRSMDWGFKAHGAIHWHAISPDDVQFVTRELTFRGKTADEVADMVLQVEESMGLPTKRGSVLTGPADTQLWEARGDRGKSKAEEFLAKGVLWEKADKNRVRNGERLVGRLKSHDHGTTSPGIVFFRTCRRAIQTLPAIGTDTKDSNKPAQGGEDHWADSIMYSQSHSSREHSAVPLEDKDEWRFEDDDKKKETQRGSLGYGGH